MNPDSLQASFWTMILVQTIGSVDPVHGPRKLPAPRVYVTAVIVWAVLQLLADSGRERAAAAMGWVTVLTALVVGGSGSKLAGFFNNVANIYGASPSAGGTATTSTTTTVPPNVSV